MDRNFLKVYNTELRHVRGMAAEFARAFPKIAGRLALDGDAKEACADPFVERLIEAFAFLTARVQGKLEAQFPRFVQALLESVYPHYLCPTPSMAIVRIDVDPQFGDAENGFLVPRGASLRSLSNGTDTQCQFRTAHPVRLWPLRLTEARYYTRDIVSLGLPGQHMGRAALRIRLKTNGGAKFSAMNLDSLPVFLRGSDVLPALLCEQLFAKGERVYIKTAKDKGDVCEILPIGTVKRAGLSSQEALLPSAPRGFEGYRLLQEYFAMPERFLFVEFTGLNAALRKCECDEIDLIVEFRQAEVQLENRVDASCFALFCTPIVNLFEKQLDPISLKDRFSEFHAVADRTHPLDFEVYEIKTVTGYGASADFKTAFMPFYTARDTDGEAQAYFSAYRTTRLSTEKEKRQGNVSSYLGSDVYISLVDALNAPYRSDLLQLSLSALCTNRHLPIQIATGIGSSDFDFEIYAPASSVRCVISPTTPIPARAEGELGWRIVSHLSFNYHSIVDGGSEENASGLREMLKLYCEPHDVRFLKQLSGILAVSSKPIVRRVPDVGAIAFARGIEITVEFDESAFEGTGYFVMGSILEQFFARYATLNSFTETVIRSNLRGEIVRWKLEPGKRHLL